MTSAPDAFLSYTRFDDRHDGGAISEFRLRLSSAVRAVTGRPFEIFQDIDGIGLGEKWLGKLDQILDQARFFIPIVTPSYFSSAACRDELEKFLRAEAARGRSDLVLPIYYIECDVLEDPDLRRVDSLASAIHERQRQDWRDLRFEPFAEPRVRKALENLAREIARARRRETPLTQHQPSDKPQSAAPRLVAQFKKPPLRYGYDLAPSTIFRDIDVPWCPELVVVPAGKFMMGEGQHEVRIAYGLAVGRYPITFDEYDPFAQATDRDPPRDHGWGRGRRPVINVSWEEAKAYVQWLREETGHAYRLLSEAEWEYAARAGTTTPFWTGSTIDTAAANYDGNYTYGSQEKGEYRAKTTPVDEFEPNPWGLYDVHGNVWEWVEDCWNDGFRSAPEDGSAWTSGDCTRRVLRGGSWRDWPGALCSTNRVGSSIDNRGSNVGFRVARTLP